MAFFAQCISGSSLKAMVRGEGDDDDDDFGGSGGSNTPNDTAHGGSKMSSYSWKRLSAKSRSSLNSPKKSHAPSLAATSTDASGLPQAAMEPVMERTRSVLTDLEAVKFLVEDMSHKCWRPATPQDQDCFDRLEESDILPLMALGEGAYGSVNLCRIPAKLAGTGSSGGSAAGIISVASASVALSHVGVPLGGATRARSVSAAALTSPKGVKSASLASPLLSRHVKESLERSNTVGTAGSGDAATTSSSTDSDLALALDSAGVGAEADGQPQVSSSPAKAVEPLVVVRFESSGGLEQEDITGGTEAVAVVAEGVEMPAVERNPSLQDPQLIVAVKRVPLGWNQERELMQLHRCQQCPFIVRLFGFVEDGSEHCSYVMEWAEGGDLGVMLASLKDRRGAEKQRLLMSEGSARYYIGCLLLALEFLHGHGLLHRDIKPSNLLLTSDGTAKLADLGFTVALDANGHTVGCCGTVGYIAPEVYAYGTSKSRMSYGMPADIWSAGATLYQMLTGQVLTDRPEELLKKGWRTPTHPRFSHHLQDLLNRMLAVKPNARPQSATSVMRHPWFAAFDWAALRAGRMKAPYIPAERRRPTQHTSGGGGAATNAPSPAADAVAGPKAPEALLAGGDSLAAAVALRCSIPSPPHYKQQQQQQQHALTGGAGSSGGHRLETVVEGTSLRQGILVEGDEMVQRSALSGHGEGSIKRGREGMVRDGASFETALGTVTTAEVRAASDGAAAVAAATAYATTLGAAAPGGSDGSVMPLDSGIVTHGYRAAQVHEVPVTCPLGVAECA